jgi:hypothetical protein
MIYLVLYIDNLIFLLFDRIYQDQLLVFGALKGQYAKKAPRNIYIYLIYIHYIFCCCVDQSTGQTPVGTVLDL